jgi:hypothetical protein
VWTEHRPDVVLVRLEGHELGPEQVLSAEPCCPVPQHRLEPDLGDEEPIGGAEALDPVVVGVEEVGELLAAQALHGQDRAVLDELRRRCLLDGLLEPDGAERLHGALVEGGRTGVDGGAAVALDEQVRHAVVGEQDRGGQPDQAAADDQHRHVALGHVAHRALWVSAERKSV